MAAGAKVQDGDTIYYTTTGAVTKGDVKALGTGMVGVAMETNATTGSVISLATRGVYELPIATGTAVDQGDFVFWSGTAVTETNTQTPAGLCWADKAAGAGLTTIQVRLNESSTAAP